jgi:outer membrane biosynthesis protein TonB
MDMKKVFCILAGLTLIGLLAACDLSSYFKPKTDQPATTEVQPPPAPTSADTTTPPPPEPTAEPAPEPAPKPKPKPSTTTTTTTTTTEPVVPPPPPVDETTTVPPPKVKRAGLGVIFTGNLEQGQFRVKADNELVYELAFSGKETRATKELLLEPGQHLMKFVVIDAKGVRGVKDETMNFVSGRHQTVRVSVKDTPGAIVVEHLE